MCTIDAVVMYLYMPMELHTLGLGLLNAVKNRLLVLVQSSHE